MIAASLMSTVDVTRIDLLESFLIEGKGLILWPGPGPIISIELSLLLAFAGPPGRRLRGLATAYAGPGTCCGPRLSYAGCKGMKPVSLSMRESSCDSSKAGVWWLLFVN